MDFSRSAMILPFFFGILEVQSKIVTETTAIVTKNKDTLRVTCSPVNTSDFQEILFIRMRSDRDEPLSSRKSKIARVSQDYGLQYAKWMNRQRYIISGNLSELSTSFLSLEIPPSEVECQDTASYRCEMVFKLFNGSYVTTASENAVSVSDIDEAVSRVERVDDGHLDKNFHRLTCSVFTGNASIDIHWCMGVADETMENSVLNIESDTRNITQYRQCTFLIQNEVTVKMMEPSSGKTWLACSLHGCSNIKESKKYYLPQKNGNEKFPDSNFLVQSDMYNSGRDMSVTTELGIPALRFPEIETNMLQSCSDDNNWLVDRKYLIAGLTLATFGVIVLVLSTIIYYKARRERAFIEKRKSTFEQQSKDLSISYSKIDEDSRHRYIWISKSADNIRDDNPYSSLGDLHKCDTCNPRNACRSLGDQHKYEETKTSYMSMADPQKDKNDIIEAESQASVHTDIYVPMS